MRYFSRWIGCSRASGFENRISPHFAALALLVAMLIMIAAPNALAQDWTRVPGAHVSYQEAPPRWPILNTPISGAEVYIGGPSLTRMSDGTYIITHNLFGSGTDENMTTVHKSTNQGVSWSKVAEVTGCFWGSTFEHNGELYLYGYEQGGDSGGDIRIRKSTDHGSTWTTYTTLASGNYGGTPNMPVVYNNRLWIAVGGNRVISAGTGSNLLTAGSWTLSNAASSTGNPFGDDWQSWSEAQIVASPTTGVVIMPKIRGLPYTALIHATSSTGVSFNASATNAFPSFPGGEKKFGVQYDATSGKFYALSNAVLPAHANDDALGDEPEMIRNTATMMSSKDLINWDVERIFLYTPNIDTEPDKSGWGEAFQYFQMAYEGDDMLVASRTALDVGDGQNDPPRGHDANLCTFHRLENFRTTGPDQYIKIENGKVNLYEDTLHKDAPLGAFALGTTFSGSSITNPNGLDRIDNYMYIREAGGRILKFDGAGNFITTMTSLPGATWNTSTDSITEPGRDNRSWAKNTNGTWDDPLNWRYWGRPDTNDEIATFGSAINAQSTVTVNSSYTIKGMRFMAGCPYRYNITGNTATNATLTLDADSGRAIIDVQQVTTTYDPKLFVKVQLNDDTDCTIVAGGALNFCRDVNLNGKIMHKKGAGALRFRAGTLTMNNGRLVNDGLSPIVFYDDASYNLNGDFEFLPDASLPMNLNCRYNLIDGESYLGANRFSKIRMPNLANLLGWNVDTFYTNGSATIVSVTAPEWNVNASGNWEDNFNWKNYARPNTSVEVAKFGTAIASNRTITVNESVIVKGLQFTSGTAARYNIVGSTATNPTLRLMADSGNAIIDVQAGWQRLSVDTILYDDTNLTFASSAWLDIYKLLDLNGKTLYKTGVGTFKLRGTLDMNGGNIVTDGLGGGIGFYDSGSFDLDGDFTFTPDASLSLVLGAAFDLIYGESYLDGETFDNLYLPTLDAGLAWNSSTFYTDGIVRIVTSGLQLAAVPEPSAIALVLTALAFLLVRRRSVNRSRRG